MEANAPMGKSRYLPSTSFYLWRPNEDDVFGTIEIIVIFLVISVKFLQQYISVNWRQTIFLQICFGIITMYKYEKIEDKWTLRLVDRIRHMNRLDDIILGQPLLIWSAYTYNSALGTSPPLWVCLVIEEFRNEIKRVIMVIMNGYCTLFPRHKPNNRALKNRVLLLKNYISHKLSKYRS